MRQAAVALALLAGLATAPAAAAWTTLAGGVQNIVVPATLVTQAGTELVSFESPTADTISVSRNRGAPAVVVANDPVAGRTQLVQQPNGAIQLYFPNAQGVARLTSTDDGMTWTGPIQTQSHDVGGVDGATVAPDGTPLFSQDGTGFVNVFRGLNGEQVQNVYAPCCGYDESLAIDTAGLVQVAFYSNASANGAFVYQPLGADLSPGAPTSLAPTVEHSPSVPLVADRSGNTFMAWAPGYPTATAFTVVPFRAGQPAGDGVTFHAAFGGGDPHMALSVDSSDRLWAVWTGQGVLHVARSRTHGMDFGAEVRTAVPGTAYQVSAVGLPGSPGAVDVIVNTGSSLIEQQLQPGLAVKLSKTAKRVGRKTVVTWFAQALDDGFGVPTATFTGGGRTVHANVAGKASLKGLPKGSAKAAAPGYAGAAFRVP
ncbi:MAG TPA: hypothetical protein VMS63_06405 [Gaiellaceae bacterium]|nr:hypothetical protein [Gaiellaceae bacterium]